LEYRLFQHASAQLHPPFLVHSNCEFLVRRTVYYDRED
jgi:hypothetical protein